MTRIAQVCRLVALKPRRFPARMLRWLAGALLLAGNPVVWGESILDLPVVLVSGDRPASTWSSDGVGSAVFSAVDLKNANPALLDDWLRSRPEFGTWRNLSGAIAHPTSQGIQLRQIATNATSRALLLLDGIPMNDPFGGWIHWARFQMNSIESLEIHPPGTAVNWGNFGAGGAVAVRSKSAFETGASLDLELAEPFAYRASLFLPAILSDEWGLTVGLQHYENDGFHTLRPADRGRVDESQGVTSSSFRGRMEWRQSDHWKGFVSADYHREQRRNGTPLNRNNTETWQVAGALTRSMGEQAWIQVHGYFQDLSFDNLFSSVVPGRDSEVPALDQFDVPARSAGLNALWQVQQTAVRSSQIGLDFRWVEGTVNEDFRYLGQGFTRRRAAGGEQSQVAVYLDHQHEWTDHVTWKAQLRFDRHRLTNGFRNEFVLPSGKPERLESWADRTLNHLTWGSGLHYRLTQRQTVSARIFQGYRVPSLNELYRPFRVGNEITESNAALDAESYLGWEAGWRLQRNPDAILQVQVFQYHLRSMIANVLLSTQPGQHPEYGFIPVGGSFSRRESIDRALSQGLQVELRQSFGGPWTGTLHYLLSDTEIRQSDFPDLKGSSFAQSSKHSLVSTMHWMPDSGFSAWVSSRLTSHRFESLGNMGRLGSVFQIDLGLAVPVRSGWNLSLHMHNLFDRESQTGLSSGGLYSIGQPRTFRLTLRNDF
jgi:outer membrane receptor protein involved in Fe transport